MVTLQVEQQLRPDRSPRGDRDVGVLEAALAGLHHRLLEAALGGAEECDGEVAGGCGGDGGEEAGEGEHGGLGDGQLAPQRRVHVQPAELLPDLGQLRVDAAQAEIKNILKLGIKCKWKFLLIKIFQ